MRHHLKPLIALSCTALLLSACGESPNARSSNTGSEAPSELVFAVVPTDNSEELLSSFEPVVAAIEEEAGIPVSIQAVSNNAGVIEAQVSQRVDVAVYGAFSYYLASDVADVTPIAMDQLTPEAGSGAVSSVGVTIPGSDITSLADVDGKDVCFTDPASTTGYLAAAAGLIEEGIDPEDDINPVFTGSHDVAVTQMIAGDCDIAFVAQTFVDVLLPARGVIEDGDTETIWVSDGIPGTPMVVGTWLPEDLQESIRRAMSEYNAVTAAEAGFCADEDQRPAPEQWGDEYTDAMACEWGGTGAFAFEPATDESYDPIREICEATQAEVCRDDS
ncbi:phosphate/phosphite/phosphonate ABC transporter substrate-binding protein [Citricoccus muralis]|uniref:Phosphate/phosphite/phosphonate ABC transporter substrate-binding protein n=1 Tax=Citricoccus muralis TaxID=169134 RepID=A0ABY8H524_9MICC|nr:phosphate/phosphite/phosphonate ABC transporter substrate-binding protein [Citricoccus muralis]WFP16239.1 phosphate/phosphite/phosphonate ABC transporter substrate-binding protein [Citricoccus muralis]